MLCTRSYGGFDSHYPSPYSTFFNYIFLFDERILAQEIALLRKAQHISQAQLAKEIKTSQQVISRLESPRDKRMPSLELLDRVARALNRKLIISLQS